MPYLPLSDKMVALVARRFRTMGDPLRLRILQTLECGEAPVHHLVVATGATQSNVSRHLQVLHDAGLVSRRRDGNFVFYGIADPMVLQLCRLVCRSAERDARQQVRQFQRDRQRRHTSPGGRR